MQMMYKVEKAACDRQRFEFHFFAKFVCKSRYCLDDQIENVAFVASSSSPISCHNGTPK